MIDLSWLLELAWLNSYKKIIITFYNSYKYKKKTHLNKTIYIISILAYIFYFFIIRHIILILK